jgi:hypothetical protein
MYVCAVSSVTVVLPTDDDERPRVIDVRGLMQHATRQPPNQANKTTSKADVQGVLRSSSLLPAKQAASAGYASYQHIQMQASS